MRFFLLILLTLTTLLNGEDFRKGKVKVDNLRMRSKAGTPSDVLGELAKGTQVKILEEKGGWLRIAAPDTLTAWTSKKFIENGEITGDGVRVRSGPNVAYHIIGKLNKGDKVEILEVKKEVWAKIKVPEDLSVWISAAFVEMEVKEVVVDTEEEKRKREEQARLEKEEADKMAALQAKLEAEKKAKEEARKKLLEQEKELARLEMEKNQAEIARQEQEKKVAVIKKLLELEEKKRSKKLVVHITNEGKIKVGSQETAFEDLESNFKAAGQNTLVFIKTDSEADEALIKKVSDKFKELDAKVYLEDPSTIFNQGVSQLSKEMKESKMILEKSYITLTVKKPRLLYVGTVPIPEEHLESVLKSYGENFGSSAYIQADPGSDKVFVNNLMKIVQQSGFKLVSFPKGFDENEVVAVQPLQFNDEEDKPLPAGRIRMTGYVLNVRKEDRGVVDYALAVKVNENYYPIAFLKGKKQEMQSFYLKEVEIIGVQKRLEGWTKPILFVEQLKPTK